MGRPAMNQPRNSQFWPPDALDRNVRIPRMTSMVLSRANPLGSMLRPEKSDLPFSGKSPLASHPIQTKGAFQWGSFDRNPSHPFPVCDPPKLSQFTYLSTVCFCFAGFWLVSKNTKIKTTISKERPCCCKNARKRRTPQPFPASTSKQRRRACRCRALLSGFRLWPTPLGQLAKRTPLKLPSNEPT